MTPTRSGHRCRRVAVMMAVVVGVVALELTGATTPWRVSTAAALGCAADPGDHVAVVVDFGAAPGAPNGVYARCVTKTTAMRNGLQALRSATGGSVGVDASGKVCQIMGLPARFDPSNCSAPHDGTLSYWAYFRGSAAGWTYSAVGAAGARADPAVVEGWRFVTVPLSQQTRAAPPPRNFPDGPSYRWESTCPAVRPPVPTRPPATTAAVPSPPREQPATGSHTPAGRRPSPDAGDPRPEANHDAAGNGRQSTDAQGTTATTMAGASTTTAPARRGATTTTTPATSTTMDGTTGLRAGETARRLDARQVRDAAEAPVSSSGGVAGAVVVGIGATGVVVSVLVSATLRSRRRRDQWED